ncbi:MAG: class I SAM-dependent methyltransferase [Gammaproteobacteria bacterium]|nr:class I SAM-dependent methyltransferase [Gammaproteobacteria bacterium]
MSAKSGVYVNKRDDVLDVISGFVKKDDVILDVGCGTGDFGELLKGNSTVEVWGVEPVEKAAEQAENKLDGVFRGFFSEGASIPDNHFDIITFNDSLEHFPDPFPPLRLAKKKLRPGGVVVSSIPNVRYISNVKHFLFDKDWKYEDKGILDRTHLKFFTKKSMLRTYKEAGYEVLDIQGVNPHRWNLMGILFLRLVAGKFIEDMKYLQYVVVARPIQK